MNGSGDELLKRVTVNSVSPIEQCHSSWVETISCLSVNELRLRLLGRR